MHSFLYLFEFLLFGAAFIVLSNIVFTFASKIKQKRAPIAQELSKNVWEMLSRKDQTNPFVKSKLPLSSWVVRGSSNQLILIDGSSWDKEQVFGYWSVLEDFRKIANADEAWAMPIYRLTPRTLILVADNHPDGANCQQTLRSKCWSGDLDIDWVSFAKRDPELWKETRYYGLNLPWIECIFLEIAAPGWTVHSNEYDLDTVLWFGEKTKPFSSETYANFIELGWCSKDDVLALQNKILKTIENSTQLKGSRWLNYEMIAQGEKENLLKGREELTEKVDPRFLSAL